RLWHFSMEEWEELVAPPGVMRPVEWRPGVRSWIGRAEVEGLVAVVAWAFPLLEVVAEPGPFLSKRQRNRAQHALCGNVGPQKEVFDKILRECPGDEALSVRTWQWALRRSGRTTPQAVWRMTPAEWEALQGTMRRP